MRKQRGKKTYFQNKFVENLEKTKKSHCVQKKKKKQKEKLD